MNQRRVQRAEAMGQLLRGVTTATIVVVTALLLLTQLNVDIAPLLASAGVLGVALGFGAQTMVKDFLTGIFLVAEDQLGVGDVVDLGPAIGTVEEVGLLLHFGPKPWFQRQVLSNEKRSAFGATRIRRI